MNRQDKTTRVPNAGGQAGSRARDAQRRRRPPARNGRVARAAVPLFGLMLATLICPAPVLAGAYSASGSVVQEFYPAGPPATSSVGPKKATFRQQYLSGDLNLVSKATASEGNLRSFALASINKMTNWSSGHVWANASARIEEPVDPLWEMWASYGATFDFQYAIGVHGGVYATSGGAGAAGSQASLLYSYRVGDSNGSGEWSLDSAGRESKNGTWNETITSSFTAHPGSSFNLELVATAATFGAKTYVPGSETTVVANANFSHTLTWLGITGVRAFDSQGNEVALPADAYLPLIGRYSGVDYWQSAAVPELPTGFLLASGMIAAGLMRKRVFDRGLRRSCG
jgi:hypothetical protein